MSKNKVDQLRPNKEKLKINRQYISSKVSYIKPVLNQKLFQSGDDEVFRSNPTNFDSDVHKKLGMHLNDNGGV